MYKVDPSMNTIRAKTTIEGLLRVIDALDHGALTPRGMVR